MKVRDPKVTEDKIAKIKELLSYFDEVVLVTPHGLHRLHNLSPARGDDRLYIHGVEEVPEEG